MDMDKFVQYANGKWSQFLYIKRIRATRRCYKKCITLYFHCSLEVEHFFLKKIPYTGFKYAIKRFPRIL